LVRDVSAWLAEARAVRLPRGAIAAALPAVLARSDLRRLQDPATERGRGLLDRLRVIVAAMRRRV
jgi:hypothetical protein